MSRRLIPHRHTESIKFALQLVHHPLLAGPPCKLVLGAYLGEAVVGGAQCLPCVNKAAMLLPVKEAGVRLQQLTSVAIGAIIRYRPPQRKVRPPLP